MKNLSQETFICIDCESTGLDTANDSIIEVGAVVFTQEGPIDTFEQLVDPKRVIPAESMAIHHITDEMVAGKPTIDQVLPQLLEMVGRATIIGHGIGFDLQLIDNEAKRSGITSSLYSRRTIDTLRLARLYGESPRNSLEVLRSHFGIPAETAHRALDDALINMKVFWHLVRSFKTLDQIFKTLEKPIALRNMPLGKHKGRPFNEIPVEYLRWAARQDFDQDLLFSLRSEIKKRKGGNSFRQSGNPFGSL